MTADQVAARQQAHFTGREAAEASPLLGRVLEALASGMFSPDERGRFRPLVDVVVGEDPFMVGADFDSYWQTQRQIDARWRDRRAWWRSSLLNTSRMAWFSSDRTISEYAEQIWNVPVGHA
jgi:starch phosphorylase